MKQVPLNKISKSIKCYSLDQSPFYKLKKERVLAKILSISLTNLRSYCKYPSDKAYREFDITKNNKIRHIAEPIGPIKQLHKRIKLFLSHIKLPDFLFSPVKGKSYIDNAKQHINTRETVNIDIKEYFPSTSASKVYNFFYETMQCSENVAWMLTQLCTYNGHLPTGSPVSPYLSFMAHYKMWLRISELCSAENCFMTVYVDDLSISGEIVLKKLIFAVKKEIHNAKLKYHSGKKFSHYKNSTPKLVTGVILKNGEMLLPNRQHKKIYDIRKKIQECSDEKEKERLTRSREGCLSQKQQIDFASKSFVNTK